MVHSIVYDLMGDKSGSLEGPSFGNCETLAGHEATELQLKSEPLNKREIKQLNDCGRTKTQLQSLQIENEEI